MNVAAVHLLRDASLDNLFNQICILPLLSERFCFPAVNIDSQSKFILISRHKLGINNVIIFGVDANPVFIIVVYSYRFWCELGP